MWTPLPVCHIGDGSEGVYKRPVAAALCSPAVAAPPNKLVIIPVTKRKTRDAPNNRLAGYPAG